MERVLTVAMVWDWSGSCVGWLIGIISEKQRFIQDLLDVVHLNLFFFYVLLYSLNVMKIFDK